MRLMKQICVCVCVSGSSVSQDRSGRAGLQLNGRTKTPVLSLNILPDIILTIFVTHTQLVQQGVLPLQIHLMKKQKRFSYLLWKLYWKCSVQLMDWSCLWMDCLCFKDETEQLFCTLLSLTVICFRFFSLEAWKCVRLIAEDTASS